MAVYQGVFAMLLVLLGVAIGIGGSALFFLRDLAETRADVRRKEVIHVAVQAWHKGLIR